MNTAALLGTNYTEHFHSKYSTQLTAKSPKTQKYRNWLFLLHH
uniref:Uncharacterized protein n=1 Tax=Anguilla anguilla TaxID=7936 RepID=A0A0E9SRR4_ANGAN